MHRTATIARDDTTGEQSLTLTLPDGDLATDCTVMAMRAMAEDASESSHRVKQLARVLSGGGCMPKNLYDWCRAHVQFRRDGRGLEHIRHPDQTLRQIEAGGAAEVDCDCLATLACAVLNAAHWPAAFVVVGRAPAPAPFGHVFWATFDTFVPGRMPWKLPDNTTPSRMLPSDPQERTPFGQMPEGVRRFRVYPF